MVSKHLNALLFLSGLVCSCDMIDYHPYDAQLSADDTYINERNIAKIESATAGKDTIRFIFFGDTQRYYDETEEFIEHINAQKDSIDFMIHGGDYTEFGTTTEYEWTADILEKSEIPYVGLIGNHDILGNGESVFATLFGDDNFAFVAGKVKFVCLNTNALEYDYSNPVPDFDFIYTEIVDSTRQVDKTIVVMHAPPGSEEFNNNVDKFFEESINLFPNLQFCLHAHNHNVSAEDLFGDGIIYYGCANIGKRNYLRFTLTPDSYLYESIDF